MAYKSKFTGKQIDDYLDSIGTKQDKLVDGVNIATINGQSLTNGGDVTIESGAKVYNWNWSGAISGTLTQEEYDGINNADLINVSINGELSSLNIIREGGVIQLFSQRTFVENQDLQTVCLIIRIQEDKSYVLEPAGGVIPTRISQLENDNNFISSDNIKTINGESIVGSGDITISGGSSSGNGAYSEVNHGTSDTTFALTPNVFHVWDEVSTLTLTLGSETSGVANEFLFQFTSGSTATTLSLPSDLKWTEELVIEPNMIYQVSILKGLASVLSWENAAVLTKNYLSKSSTNLVFEYPVASEVLVVVNGRTTSDAASSVPHNFTLTYAVGEQTKTIRSVFSIVSITPTSDDVYEYISTI